MNEHLPTWREYLYTHYTCCLQLEYVEVYWYTILWYPVCGRQVILDIHDITY